MSARVLLNLLYKLRKSDKMRGLAEHFIAFFRIGYYVFNNTRARMLDSIYHVTLRLL